jgi:hypothetical protein
MHLKRQSTSSGRVRSPRSQPRSPRSSHPVCMQIYCLPSAARVKRIVRECHRTNEKFTDPEFDIEDLSEKNCLQGLKYWYNEKPATAASTVSASRLGSALSTLVQADILVNLAAPTDLVSVAKLLTRPTSDDKDEPSPGSV